MELKSSLSKQQEDQTIAKLKFHGANLSFSSQYSSGVFFVFVLLTLIPFFFNLIFLTINKMLFSKIKFNLLSEYSLTLRAHEKNAI